MRESGLGWWRITGSVGKTTTKEMLAHVLAGRYRVFRNPANYSGISACRSPWASSSRATRSRCSRWPSTSFGEMDLMTRLAPPEVAVVTVVAPAHLASVRQRWTAVAQEKGAPGRRRCRPTGWRC